MNEHRMSPSGVNTSGIDSLLKMGSTNNAAGALTEGSLNVIEAELKAQNYQLDAASEFAEVGASIINSQLQEVGDQAQQQKDGDSESAWGEIGGGIFGLTTSVGGLGAGNLSFGRDSDELKELDGFKGQLDQAFENNVVMKASTAAPTGDFGKILDKEISEAEKALADKKGANGESIEQLNGKVEKLNIDITQKETASKRCREELKTLQSQENKVEKVLMEKRKKLDDLCSRRKKLEGQLDPSNGSLLEVRRREYKSKLLDVDAKIKALESEVKSYQECQNTINQGKQKAAELDKLNEELTVLRNEKDMAAQELANLQKDSKLSELKKQKALYEKLTKSVINSGNPELDLSNLNQYDKETQEAVLKGMSTEEKARLRTHFDRAYARASKVSQEERSRKWQMAGSLAQMVAQPGMGVAQGMGQMKGLGDHMAATNYGAIAQVDGTLGGQYTQAASSKASEADSNLRTALQVAQSIRG